MAEKKVKAVVKLLIQAGKANPAPPIGSVLGPFGINLPQFCSDFNAKTSGGQGSIPCVVTVYDDRSFSFILKTPPVADLVKIAIGIKKGAGKAPKEVAGTITMAQVQEIAKQKMADLNSYDRVDSIVNQIIGTCKSMGVKVV
ncbi:MAG: 50S ribosomal protein L11 [Patescibacteria group bacterium]